MNDDDFEDSEIGAADDSISEAPAPEVFLAISKEITLNIVKMLNESHKAEITSLKDAHQIELDKKERKIKRLVYNHNISSEKYKVYSRLVLKAIETLIDNFEKVIKAGQESLESATTNSNAVLLYGLYNCLNCIKVSDVFEFDNKLASQFEAQLMAKVDPKVTNLAELIGFDFLLEDIGMVYINKNELKANLNLYSPIIIRGILLELEADVSYEIVPLLQAIGDNCAKN